MVCFLLYQFQVSPSSSGSTLWFVFPYILNSDACITNFQAFVFFNQSYALPLTKQKGLDCPRSTPERGSARGTTHPAPRQRCACGPAPQPIPQGPRAPQCLWAGRQHRRLRRRHRRGAPGRAGQARPSAQEPVGTGAAGAGSRLRKRLRACRRARLPLRTSAPQPPPPRVRHAGPSAAPTGPTAAPEKAPSAGPGHAQAVGNAAAPLTPPGGAAARSRRRRGVPCATGAHGASAPRLAA